MSDPTTWEWVAAGIGAGLVAVLLAVLALRPVLARSRATPWGRAGGLLLGTAATGLFLVVVIAIGAAAVGDRPSGAFAGVLVHADGRVAERIGAYAAALLIPLAAVLGVLAVAVVDVGRPSGLRIAAGLVAGVLLVVGLTVATGDTGSAPTVVGWSASVLAGAAAVALVLDELVGGRQSRSSRSASSTTSSQRSPQSRHR